MNNVEQRVSDLLKQPQIVCRGDINTSLYVEISGRYRSLAAEQVKQCCVVIDSDGGSVESGLDIYNVIRLSYIKTGLQSTAFVTRASNSAAILVLLGCEHRIGLSEARYMMHPVGREITLTVPFLNKMSRNKKWLDDIIKNHRIGITKSQKSMNRIYSDRTKMTAEMITMVAKSEKVFDSFQAMEAGLIHEMISI